MMLLLDRLVQDTDGQDLIEYALLAGFISLVWRSPPSRMSEPL